MKRVRWMVALSIVVAFGCRSKETERMLAEGSNNQALGDNVDYATARRTFRTQLVRKAPSPQRSAPLVLATDARDITYRSGDLVLPAWISEAPKGVERAPAVLFLHGGFGFGGEDWD